MRAERQEKIEKIFQSAVDRSADDRTAYLDQACNGDANLRREVESMISS
jgi:hypothetical protein